MQSQWTCFDDSNAEIGKLHVIRVFAVAGYNKKYRYN